MWSRHRLAEVAALLGNPGRAGMLAALQDGGARPAGELARVAGVTPATASAHLARLVDVGLLRVEPRGRHRWFRLAGPDVAHAIEALAALVPPRAAPDDDGAVAPLRRARMCYDHLAGELGVSVADGLLARGWLELRDAAFVLRPAGRRGFAKLGIDAAALERARRPLLRSCLDWTERRAHLGGALGAALAAHALEVDWVRRLRGSRVVIATSAGRRELQRLLGVRWA